jgi:hypothetical protein
MRRFVVLVSAALAFLTGAHDTARAQGETAAALASPHPVFDANVVVRAVQANLSRARAVYLRRLRVNPRLNGRVVIEFMVSSGLVVDDVAVAQNTTGDGAFGKEIGAALLAFDWPRMPIVGGTVRFSYPFVFSPLE